MPATASTAPLPSPPPTVNSLHASQRTRLPKSTSKLADLLGTTPHLLDLAFSPTRPSSPTSVLLYLSPSSASSVTSSSSIHEQLSNVVVPGPPPKGHRRRNSTGISCPLLRRLRKARSTRRIDANVDSQQPSAGSIDSPAPFVLTSPPPSPLVGQERSPIILDDEAKIRRKRICKLTRTLGENIPTELVFSKPKVPLKSHNEPEKSVRLTLPKPHYPKLRLDSLLPSPEAFQRTIQRLSVIGPSGKTPSLVRRTSSLGLVHPSVEQPRNNDPTWDGEWNIKDAEKRAMALRNLRSR